MIVRLVYVVAMRSFKQGFEDLFRLVTRLGSVNQSIYRRGILGRGVETPGVAAPKTSGSRTE
jgi:hypothetical protein